LKPSTSTISYGFARKDRPIQKRRSTRKNLAAWQIQIGEKIFRAGDRVIQTSNNYDLGVFNGCIGNIQAIKFEDYTCRIGFASTGEAVTYEKEDLRELALAYAVTIHKSQGSEFEAVIIPVSLRPYGWV
jgi:ATP-dependent exoDNAse (exonuclease V) alpha subunit